MSNITQGQSDFEDILTEKEVLEHELYPLLSPAGHSAAREALQLRATKSDILAKILCARYQGERVSAGWGKDVLIDAYLEIRIAQLQTRLATLNRHMCEILEWDYAKIER